MIIDCTLDNHVHTPLCNHASGTMEQYVQAGVAAGLERIVFLEHLETGINTAFRSWLTDADFDVFFAEGNRLKKRYEGRIEIGLGAEVGYNPDCPQRILERIGEREWDRLGLSYHFITIPGHDEHVNMLSRNRQNLALIDAYGDRRLLTRYFDTLIEAVQAIPAHTLCHLDAGLRHQPNLYLEDSHYGQIEILLRQVKRAGMTLEINTSGYAYRGEPFPRPQVFTAAENMGLGFSAASDAHSPEEVGRFFDRIPGLLRQP